MHVISLLEEEADYPTEWWVPDTAAAMLPWEEELRRFSLFIPPAFPQQVYFFFLFFLSGWIGLSSSLHRLLGTTVSTTNLIPLSLRFDPLARYTDGLARAPPAQGQDRAGVGADPGGAAGARPEHRRAAGAEGERAGAAAALRRRPALQVRLRPPRVPPAPRYAKSGLSLSFVTCRCLLLPPVAPRCLPLPPVARMPSRQPASHASHSPAHPLTPPPLPLPTHQPSTLRLRLGRTWRTWVGRPGASSGRLPS